MGLWSYCSMTEPCRRHECMNLKNPRIADSSSKNAVSFSSERNIKRLPSPQWASTIRILHPSESTAETQPPLIGPLSLACVTRSGLGPTCRSASRELHSAYLPLYSGVAYLCLVRQMQPWTKASCDAGEASTKAQPYSRR